MTLPKGLYTALVTPFNEDFSLNIPALVRHVNELIEAGVDALLAVGSTGEGLLLNAEEREAVIKAVVQTARGRVPILAGTGSSSTQETIQNSLQAKACGADAFLITAPPYLKPTQEGIFQHYRAIAEAVKAPIILYQHPKRSASEIEFETVQRLSTVPYIEGIKVCSSSLSFLMDLTGSLRTDFCILSGDCQYTLPHIAVGASGVISGTSNLIPHQMKELTQLSLKGELNRAKELTCQLLPLFRALTQESNPIPIKAALNLAGKEAGPPRLPLTPLSEASKTDLRRLLDQLFQALV